MNGTVDVAVSRLSGQCLRLNAGTVYDLKEQVFREWNVPPVCQVILCGTKMLENNQCLRNLPEINAGASMLSVTMTVSLVKVYDILQDRNASNDSREASLLVLGKMAHKNDERAVGVLRVFVDAPAVQVRRAAVIASAHFFGKEDEYTTKNTLSIAANDDSYVAEAAIQVLPMLVEKGDARAIKVILTQIVSGGDQLQEAAASTLSLLVHDRDEKTIQSVIQIWEDPGCYHVRACVVTVLASLVAPHDARAFNVACKALYGSYASDDNTARCLADAAMRAWVHLGKNGNSAAVKQIQSCMEDLDAPAGVMASAVMPWGQLAKQGDDKFIDTMVKFMQDTSMDVSVRSAAIDALKGLAEKGDERVILAAAAVVEDPLLSNIHDIRQIRERSVSLLMKVAGEGNQRAIAALEVLVEKHPG